MDHLESNGILTTSQQHGFRKKRSCETQLLELSDELTSNLAKGYQTDIVILDFAKAFDKVNHSLLVHKLAHYGITGRVNAWIQNFLKDRRQAVVVEGSKSEPTEVRSGVPQGSVLGPCLFLIYINDLPSYVQSNTRLFADDTAVDRVIKSDEDRKALQQDLDSLARWEKQWDMEFHPGKCTVLSVTRSRNPQPAVYSLHGQELKQVQEAKYLGATIQNDGEWSRHIEETSKKANRTLGFLRRNLKIGSKQTKQRAYKQLVRPTLEYACPVWDPHKQVEIDLLEKTQRRAARFVTNRHRNTSSVTDMLSSLQWPTLRERRRQTRLTLMYKVLNEETKVQNNLEAAVARERRSRTHCRQLRRAPVTKKQYRDQSFFPATICDWNDLPPDVVQATSLASFKARLARTQQ